MKSLALRLLEKETARFLTLSEALAFEDSPQASLLGTTWRNFVLENYATAEAAED